MLAQKCSRMRFVDESRMLAMRTDPNEENHGFLWFCGDCWIVGMCTRCMCQRKTAQISMHLARRALYGPLRCAGERNEARQAESPPDCLEGKRTGSPSPMETTTNTIGRTVGDSLSIRAA